MSNKAQNGEPRSTPSAASQRARTSQGSTGNGKRVKRTLHTEAKRRLALLVLLVGIVVESASLFACSPVFAVRHVTVTVRSVDNVSSLPPQENIKLLEAARLSSRFNWLLPFAQHTINRNCTNLPFVKEANVSRRIPFTMEATVSIRNPICALMTQDGQFEMDDTGHIIRNLRADGIGKLRMVTFTTKDKVLVGSAVKFDLLGTVTSILKNTGSDRLLRIVKIEVDHSNNIWLNMDNGVRIRFGDKDKVAEKLAMIRRLLSSDPKQGSAFDEINVSNPDWPAIREHVSLPTSALRHIVAPTLATAGE